MYKLGRDLQIRNVDHVLLDPRFEVFEARSQVDVVLLLRVVELVTSGPVVADRVGKDLSVAAERARRDGLVHRFRRLELRSGILKR